MRIALVFVLLSACGPLVQGSDSGSPPPPTDSGAKETSTQCIADYAGCVTGQTCCTPGYVCNASTTVCQPACTPINGLCSDNSQCCSGICNGSCQ